MSTPNVAHGLILQAAGVALAPQHPWRGERWRLVGLADGVALTTRPRRCGPLRSARGLPAPVTFRRTSHTRGKPHIRAAPGTHGDTERERGTAPDEPVPLRHMRETLLFREFRTLRRRRG